MIKKRLQFAAFFNAEIQKKTDFDHSSPLFWDRGKKLKN